MHENVNEQIRTNLHVITACNRTIYQYYDAQIILIEFTVEY